MNPESKREPIDNLIARIENKRIEKILSSQGVYVIIPVERIDFLRNVPFARNDN